MYAPAACYEKMHNQRAMGSAMFDPIELRSTSPEKMFHRIETNAVGADIVNHCLCGSPGAGYAV
jgi:hypothetical protein